MIDSFLFFHNSTIQMDHRSRRNQRIIKLSMTMNGVKQLCIFTNWAYTMLNLSFFLNAYLALYPSSSNGWLMRLGVVVFDCAVPSCMLVSSVTKYDDVWVNQVEWRQMFDSCTSPPSCKMRHNLNSMLVIGEVALLGGLPVRIQEITIFPLFAFCYVVFAWATGLLRTTGRQQTERRSWLSFTGNLLGYVVSSMNVLKLIGFLVGFNIICSWIATLGVMLDYCDCSWLHVAFVTWSSSIFCRFRD
mmetsp:Transcript_22607/g.34545  ORF Transcript_22607/g.34545 Transcript_22607/m.34545 type:complete len:245 (+) Transcript_22607:83-817(+)